MREVYSSPTIIFRQGRTVMSAVVLTALACVPGGPIHGADGQVVPTVVVTRPETASGREVELPGSFEPYQQVLLHAKVTGYVARVHADIGDRVTRGTALVELDVPEMKPALIRAQADVVAAEAAQQKAQSQAERDRITYQRLSDLQTSEPLAVIQQDVDMAAAELQVSEAVVRSARAEVAVAQAKIGELKALMAYAVIRAPFDGVVIRRFIHPGALVVSGADGGEPVLEVVREDRLRLVLAIPEPVVPFIRAGIPVEITLDVLPQRIFTATVTRYAGALTPDTRTMRTEIDMDSQEGLLRPGMYATVRLRLGGDEGLLSVSSALIRHEEDGGAFLWTVRDGVVEKTSVEISRDDGVFAVIRTGLQQESLVVLEGPTDLDAGQAVSIRERTEGAQ